jgi:hypothetical protein
MRASTISIFVSVIAIFISALSWHEAREARLISATVSRPVFDVTAVTLDTVDQTFEGSRPFNLVVKNVGTAIGKTERVDAYFTTEPISFNVESFDIPKTQLEGTLAEILPNETRQVGIVAFTYPLPKIPGNPPMAVSARVFGDFSYTGLNREIYHRRWCFTVSKTGQYLNTCDVVLIGEHRQ